MSDDWMDDELIGILEGKKRPKRRWWAVAARPIPPGTQAGVAPPLDSLPASVGAFGFRKLSTAYGGSAMQVLRVSDSATQNIGFVGNNFDSASFSAFIGASTGRVNIWYDQSGSGNDLVVFGSAPTITMTGLNGLPTAVWGGAPILHHASTPSMSEPVTMNAVAIRTSNFTGYNGIVGEDSGNGYGLFFANAANSVMMGAGANTANVACSDNVAHSITGLVNGASSAITVDGTTTSGLVVGSVTFAGLHLGNLAGFSLNGNLSESLFWSSQLSGANITALATNQKAYWGTP